MSHVLELSLFWLGPDFSRLLHSRARKTKCWIWTWSSAVNTPVCCELETRIASWASQKRIQSSPLHWLAPNVSCYSAAIYLRLKQPLQFWDMPRSRLSKFKYRSHCLPNYMSDQNKLVYARSEVTKTGDGTRDVLAWHCPPWIRFRYVLFIRSVIRVQVYITNSFIFSFNFDNSWWNYASVQTWIKFCVYCRFS